MDECLPRINAADAAQQGRTYDHLRTVLVDMSNELGVSEITFRHLLDLVKNDVIPETMKARYGGPRIRVFTGLSVSRNPVLSKDEPREGHPPRGNPVRGSREPGEGGWRKTALCYRIYAKKILSASLLEIT